MRVSSKEWRLSFFWLEAETNLCAQGSGLCGAAGGQAGPFPSLGALGLSQGGTDLAAHPLLPWEGFTPSSSSWLFPAPAPRELRAPWQLGGCRCGPAAADLHVCLHRATSIFLHIPPQGCQHVAVSQELLPTPWQVLSSM